MIPYRPPNLSTVKLQERHKHPVSDERKLVKPLALCAFSGCRDGDLGVVRISFSWGSPAHAPCACSPRQELMAHITGACQHELSCCVCRLHQRPWGISLSAVPRNSLTPTKCRCHSPPRGPGREDGHALLYSAQSIGAALPCQWPSWLESSLLLLLPPMSLFLHLQSGSLCQPPWELSVSPALQVDSEWPGSCLCPQPSR